MSVAEYLTQGGYSEPELQWLRVAGEDSVASDHLMLVVDCEFYE